MTYEQTEFELVSLKLAARECRDHGARLIIENMGFVSIHDAGNGDRWATLPIIGEQVSARAVLDALGY